MSTIQRFRHAIQFIKLGCKSANYQRRIDYDHSILRQLSVPSTNHARLSSQAATEKVQEQNHHNIVKNTEKSIGQSAHHDFQSETRILLDIVTKSLYSDEEVFIRELISNSSDALEKLRYMRLSENLSLEEGGDRNLEIHIVTDKQNRTLTIQDTGIGMSHEELISNLGTIAHSGSKAFLEKLKEGQTSGDSAKIIGQFGVGFYSAFMVADRVEVFTKSFKKDAEGLHWSSDGLGTYEISKAEGVQPGTKLVLYLKADCRKYSDETTVDKIVKKYSNFIGNPIFINGKQVNAIQPLWMLEPKNVTTEQHIEFYRFISNSYDAPKFTLHYTADVPLSIRAVLYFPDDKPDMFEMSRDTVPGISLYCRKVLIKNRTDQLLPKWLRFVKGVIDSEDIPLNLSRELLQNSALISKLRNVLTARVIKFLHERSMKQVEEYNEFYNDYGIFLKEGILSSHDQSEKEAISKLLRFESSAKAPGEFISLPQYCENLPADQKDIYYLAAPNRALAEQSPYYESFKKRGFQVLFCFGPYDELILMQLRQYNSRPLTSVEKEMRQNTEPDENTIINSINKEETDKLLSYMKSTLSKQAFEVKTTNRLESHPCVVTVQEMASARHFIRTQSHQLNDETRYNILQPRLEINLKHPIIKKLSKLVTSDPKLAEILTRHLFIGAMVGAGLVEDSRMLLTLSNELLTLALEKH